MLYRVHGGAEVKLGGAVDMAFERLFVLVERSVCGACAERVRSGASKELEMV